MLSGSGTLEAQIEIAPIEAKWYVPEFGMMHIGFKKYEVTGTIMIGDIEATTISVYDKYANIILGPPPNNNVTYQVGEGFLPDMYVYADEERVYIHDGEEFRMWADFSLSVGDTLIPEYKPFGSFYPSAKHVITNTGIMDVNGINLRYYDYEVIGFDWKYESEGRMIERIGLDTESYPAFYAVDHIALQVFEESYGPLFCYSDPEIGTYPDTMEECVYDLNISVSEMDKEFEDILFFPNPATNQFNIILPPGGNRLEFYDLSGQMVMSRFVYPGWDRTAVDVGGLSAGMYMVQVVRESGEVMGAGRFVRE